jgi:uncharacterized protein YkwD
MPMMFPVARLKTTILFAALLAIVATSHKTISQSEARPDPIASSVSVTRPAPAGTVAVINNTPEASPNAFVYIPLILQPGILSDFAQQVVDITNEERAKAGCAPLGVSPQLSDAAQGHSDDMALNDFFSHVGSNGSQFWERIDATGYQFWAAAENIAAGYQTPESVLAGWMGSDGHRANILNCNYQEVGVGYYLFQNDTGAVNYGHYWTQVFAQPG